MTLKYLLSSEYIIKIKNTFVYSEIYYKNNLSEILDNKLNKDFFIYYFTNKVSHRVARTVLQIREDLIYISNLSYNYYFNDFRYNKLFTKKITNGTQFIEYIISDKFNIVGYSIVAKEDWKKECILIVSKNTKIKNIKISGLKILL